MAQASASARAAGTTPPAVTFTELRDQVQALLGPMLAEYEGHDPGEVLSHASKLVVARVAGYSNDELHDLLFQALELFPAELQRAFAVWVDAGTPPSYDYPYVVTSLLEEVMYFVLEAELASAPEQ